MTKETMKEVYNTSFINILNQKSCVSVDSSEMSRGSLKRPVRFLKEALLRRTKFGSVDL